MSEIYEESLKATLGKFKRSIDNEDKKNKLFNRTPLIGGKQTYVAKGLTDREVKQAKEYENIMRTSEKFNDYIKAYKSFERIVGMPHATIIYSIKYKNEGATNTITVKYSSQEKHITIPSSNTELYHKSPNKFSELKPTFRGKQTGEGVSRGGYLYDCPRVYLSLTDAMPKAMADLKQTASYHLYKIKENLNNLIVDPAFNSPSIGAVYVKTNLPIKVDEVTKDDLEAQLKKEKAKVKKAAVGAAVAGVAVGALAANKLKDKKKVTKERVEDFYQKGYITESDRDLYIYLIDSSKEN